MGVILQLKRFKHTLLGLGQRLVYPDVERSARRSDVRRHERLLSAHELARQFSQVVGRQNGQ